MDLNLSQKTAIVCGSSQGIGKATAMLLAKMGANVILIARNEEKLKSVLTELDNNQAQKHDYIVADFSNPRQLEENLEKAKLKEKSIHILVNNTGGPAGGQAIDAKTDEFMSAFSNHLICNHILVQNIVESMKKNNYGRIVNVISTSVKQPLANLGVSNTIRGAVANWSKTLANELGKFNITVNNVLPGATKTGRLNEIMETKSQKTGKKMEDIEYEMAMQVPMQRVAQPEEIANAIVFLCSPAAAYINGINLPVDGGRTGCL
jgi:3-oxoacyl-[acyl-carrier protein] reductase